MRTRREDVAPTTREQCEAEISRHHAIYKLACEICDEETAKKEQAKVNDLFEQYSHIPQQRRP